jgi:hypothetical protein
MRSRPPDRWVPGQVALPSRSTDPAEGSIASQRLSQTGRDRPTPSSLSEAMSQRPSPRRVALRVTLTAEQVIHPHRGVALKLIDDLLIAAEDLRICVSHQLHRDRVRHAAGEQERRVAMPQRMEADCGT